VEEAPVNKKKEEPIKISRKREIKELKPKPPEEEQPVLKRMRTRQSVKQETRQSDLSSSKTKNQPLTPRIAKVNAIKQANQPLESTHSRRVIGKHKK